MVKKKGERLEVVSKILLLFLVSVLLVVVASDSVVASTLEICPGTATSCVVLYDEMDFGLGYRGTTVVTENTFFIGEYFNDKTSSLKIIGDIKVVLFEARDFAGQSKVFTADTAYIGDDWNDIVSSLKIYPKTEIVCNDNVDNDYDTIKDCRDDDCDGINYCEFNTETKCDDNQDNDGDRLTDCRDPNCYPQPGDSSPVCERVLVSTCPEGVESCVLLYEDKDFWGEWGGIPVTTDKPVLENDPFDNAISSLRIIGDIRVVVFKDNNFQGEPKIITADVASVGESLGSSWNDQISSLKIVPKTEMVCNDNIDNDYDACLKDVDCASTKYCSAGGSCLNKKSPGKPCTRNGECTGDNLCVEGSCLSFVPVGGAVTGSATAAPQPEETPEQPSWLGRFWQKIKGVFSREGGKPLAGQAYSGGTISNGFDCADSDCKEQTGPSGGTCCFDKGDCDAPGGEYCGQNSECVSCVPDTPQNKYKLNKAQEKFCNGQRWLDCNDLTNQPILDPAIEVRCQGGYFFVKEVLCTNALDDDNDGKIDRHDTDCGAGSIYPLNLNDFYEVVVKSTDAKKISVIT